ncbi:MAG: hypothetical protein JXQ27_12165 [Acidobacteria bacterium]|nr:hypothetical protein [Acidobacteriota bacterium]
MPGMLRIEPQAGLCNRLRVLAAALALSARTGQRLHVLWFRDRGLNCDFDRLFEVPSTFARLTQLHRDRWYSHYYRQWLIRHSACHLEHADVVQRGRRGRSFDDLASFPSVYLATHKMFLRDTSRFAAFVPVAELRRIIEDVVRSFDKHMVGVHVRRGDNSRAAEQSRTAAYVRGMQEEIRRQPQTRFFLATDSPEDERALRRAFPNRILVYPKTSLDRNNPQAIREAVVDLLCLARTRRLLGSYWSSFSDTAARLGGIPRITVE